MPVVTRKVLDLKDKIIAKIDESLVSLKMVS